MADARVQGAQQEVLTFLTRNADRPIALKELSENLPRADSTISSAVRGLQQKFPLQLEINAKGIYTWHSKEMSAPRARGVSAKSDFMFEVIEEREGRWLCKDVVTGKLYSVKGLEW